MIHLIQTCAVVLTGLRGALFDVQVAVGTLKSRHTEALVAVDPVFADGPILAGLRPALIHILLTVFPLVSRNTLTLVPRVRNVHADATVLARVRQTGGYVLPAVLTCPADGTVARIVACTVHAVRPDPFAGVAVTFIHFLLTAGTCVAVWAVAEELVRPRLAGAVCAGGRAAGVIQILTEFACVPDRSFGAHAHIVPLVVKTRRTVFTGR